MCGREREKERVCAPARKCKGGECTSACECCLSDGIRRFCTNNMLLRCSHLAASVNRETGRG